MKAGKMLAMCSNVSEQETIAPRRRATRTLSVDVAHPWCQRSDEAPDELGRTKSDGSDSRWHGRVARGGLRDGDLATFREPPRASLGFSDRTRRRWISVDGATVRASSDPERVTIEEFIHPATRDFTRGPAFISSAKKHLPSTPGAGSTPTARRPSSWRGKSELDFRRTRSDRSGVPPSLHQHLPPSPASGDPHTFERTRSDESPSLHQHLPPSPASGGPHTFGRTRSDESPLLHKHLPSTPGAASAPTSLRPSSRAGDSVFEFRRTRSDHPSLHVQTLSRQATKLDVQSELAWARHSLRRDSLVREDGVLLGSAYHGLVL